MFRLTVYESERKNRKTKEKRELLFVSFFKRKGFLFYFFPKKVKDRVNESLPAYAKPSHISSMHVLETTLSKACLPTPSHTNPYIYYLYISKRGRFRINRGLGREGAPLGYPECARMFRFPTVYESERGKRRVGESDDEKRKIN